MSLQGKISNLSVRIGTEFKAIRNEAALKSDIGHGHVISDVAGLQAALDTKQANIAWTTENVDNKGVANGYAGLDANGKVPAVQLPSFVDDVLEFDNLAAFPAEGESSKIYVSLDGNITYRWSGTGYVVISASPGNTDDVPEGSSNVYFTTARARSSISVVGDDLSYNDATGVITSTPYLHPLGDGNLHVPANDVTNDGAFLKATSVAGMYEWAIVSYSDISGVPDIGSTATDFVAEFEAAL